MSNAHQRRKYLRRYIKPWMSGPQRQMALGWAIAERNSWWWERNPLGSPKNPFIVSPDYLKVLTGQ